MNKIKITTLLLLGCFTFSSDLSLKDYLLKITQNDPAYMQLFLNAQSIEGSLQSLQAMYDPRLSASLQYTNQEEQPSVPSKLENINTIVGSLGVTKKLEDTGTNLSLTYVRVDNSSKMSTRNLSQINPSLTLRATQPLLKDNMGVYSNMPLKRLNIQKEIIELSIKEAEEKYFLDSLNLYYDWLSLTLALEPLNISYKNATNLHEEVKEKYRNDAALKTDLLQAENAVLIYRNALNDTLYAWNALASTIYQKMGDNFVAEMKWENLPKRPEICESFCQEEPMKTLPKLRIISTFEKTLAQYELDLEKINRETMPDLSIYGEIARYKNTDSSQESFFDLTKSEYTAGAIFSTSLGTNSTDGQTKVILSNIESTKQEILKIEKALKTQYNNNLLNLANLQKIEKNANQIAENSKAILEIETKRFSQGKTALYSLSDFRQKYTQSKIDHLNKIIAIAKLKASIASINDSLLDKINKLIGS
ncbi:MAG: TolC family protein [Candidatus Margulisbacteria bacterium]|nr:TolC family protein [Candidatus Margulisiibacteriota bacterium]